MESRQLATMRWVLFWVFVVILGATALVTLLVLFGVGTTDPIERKMLLGSSLLQVISAVVALFYLLFGIKKLPQTGGEDSHESIVKGAPVPPTPMDVNLELERLRAEITSLSALPDRVIGVLASGRTFSLKEMESLIGNQGDDRNRGAGLQACLGKLVTRGIVEHHFGSLKNYTLSKDWLQRKERRD